MPLILLQMHYLIAAFACGVHAHVILHARPISHALNGSRVITPTHIQLRLHHRQSINSVDSTTALYTLFIVQVITFYILCLSVHNMPKRQLVAGKKASTLSTDHVTRPPVPEQVQKSLIQVGMKVYLAPSSSSSLFVISLLRTLLNSY